MRYLSRKTFGRLALQAGAGALGWWAGQDSVFGLLGVLMVAAAGLPAAALIWLLAWVVGPRRPSAKPLVLLALAAFVAVSSAFLSLSVVASRRQQQLTQTLQALQRYRRQHPGYPDSLAELPGPPASAELSYYPDATRQQFRLSTRLDGWHFRAYDSQTQQWTSGD
jgi:hypothetical protein